jgi:hypothetical protein
MNAVQKQTVESDLNDLWAKGTINRKSSLSSLTPFLDKDNVLRVGGRLKNANISYDEKHPISLQKNHHVADKIIQQKHIRLYYAGIQATLYHVRTRYSLLNDKGTTCRVINGCIKCFRFAKAEQNYVMGELPKNRINPSKNFANTGIDCFSSFLKSFKIQGLYCNSYVLLRRQFI